MSARLRSRRRAVCCLALTTILSACDSARQKPPGVAERPVRIGAQIVDLADIPRLVAERELASRGTAIQTVEYARADVSFAALTRGEVDLNVGSMTLGWTAIARGAPIVTVMEVSGSRHVIVAGPDVQSCGDLHGRRIAVNSLGSSSEQLLRGYLAENCPAARPTILLVQGNTNRAASLISGAVDAAVIHRDEWLELDAKTPGRTHVVVDFGAHWPTVMSVGLFANRAFARSHREFLVDYIKACLVANRRIGSDVTALTMAIQELLERTADTRMRAETYVKARSWDPNGGLSALAVGDTIAFMHRSGIMAEPVEPARIVDRSFLDQAIAEIGAGAHATP